MTTADKHRDWIDRLIQAGDIIHLSKQEGSLFDLYPQALAKAKAEHENVKREVFASRMFDQMKEAVR